MSPQLAKSLQSAGQLGLNSPKSPDYPPKVSTGHNSPASTIITKSSMTYGLPLLSVGSTWKTNVKIIEKSFTDQQTIQPILEKNFNQYNVQNERKDIIAQSEHIDRLAIDKQVKQEPLEIKCEPNESKCKNDSTTNSHTKSHSSSSKRKDQRSERHHCTRCYKRSKIKRTSIGIQCQRDRRSSSASLYQKSLSTLGSLHKSNADNLKLNLQVKNYKLLDKQPNKNDLTIYSQGLKYKDFIHVETYPNGGASVVHMYQDEIDVLTSEQLEELAQEYFKVSSSL
jgi:hypothetical protein